MTGLAPQPGPGPGQARQTGETGQVYEQGWPFAGSHDRKGQTDRTTDREKQADR